MHNRLFSRRFALAIALSLSASSAIGATLLQPAASALDERDSVVAGLRAERSTSGLTAMQIDSSALAYDTERFDIRLDARQLVSIQRSSASYADDGSLIWTGSVVGKGSRLGLGGAPEPTELMNTVTLIKSGNEITGSLRINGRLYKLLPLASGHVLAAIDEARMPPDHPAEYKSLLVDNIGGETATLAGNPGDAATKAISTIRVMLVITNAAKAKIGNVTNFANLAISETNAGYSNSGVDINMQLAGVYTTSYVESGSFSTDLARIRGTTDGYLDSVHSLRTSNAADVVMFVIDNASSCGLASAIGASATTAFAAVHYGCATGYYSFGHEIGHLQSARHDPANDPSTTPYAYGHGYQYAAGGWRTIMAYACSNNCTRLNFWSNPAKTRSGVPMGTTSTHHNQRVLNNTKATIAAFR
jgi:peptidyl-Asp metalloendopeptidase